MSIFSRLFNSVSAGLFRFIILRNLESIETAEELDKFISNSMDNDVKNNKKDSVSELKENFLDNSDSEDIPPVKNGDKFATRRELAVSIKKLLEEINRKSGGEEISGKLAALSTVNNNLVEENTELRNQIEQLKNDIEKLSAMIITDKKNSPSDSDKYNRKRKIDFSELTMCELVDLFILNGAKYSISVNSAQSVNKYMKTILNLDSLSDFLKNNSDNDEFEPFAESMQLFKTALEKKVKEIKIMLEDYAPEDVSGEVTISIFKIISSFIIEKWIPAVYKHLHSGRDEKYMTFLKLINDYLESAGIYTYNELRKGESMTEEHLDFFKPARIQTSAENMNNVVKGIHMLPYCINYLEFGEKARHYTMGIAEVYTTEEII